MLITSATHPQATVPEPSSAIRIETAETPVAADQGEPGSGIKVTLSPEGTAKASAEKDKNADIDASNLPDGIKKILKVIREIQEKIQKKMEELDAIRNDQSLSDKDREAKTQGIMGELGVLTSQLSSSTNNLHRAENEMKLSTAQKKLSSYLSAPKN